MEYIEGMDLNNKVIKILNLKHGVEVSNFYKKHGIDVLYYSFSNTEEKCSSFIYYGLHNYIFNNYNIDDVKKYNLQIITLPLNSPANLEATIINITNDQIISRTNLKNIYDVACSAWKAKLSEKITNNNLFAETINFTDSEVEEMFNAASPSQKSILEKYFLRPTDNIAIRKNAFNEVLPECLKEFNMKAFGQARKIELINGAATDKNHIFRGLLVYGMDIEIIESKLDMSKQIIFKNKTR
jgi:hypothetical protein